VTDPVGQSRQRPHKKELRANSEDAVVPSLMRVSLRLGVHRVQRSASGAFQVPPCSSQAGGSCYFS
jgi:hypothetical protein